MQWLTLVPEYSSAQRLKADRRKPVVAGSVEATAPATPAHAATGGEHPPAGLQPAGERRREERRSGNERRRRQLPVLLDTRCSHDRRVTASGETRRPTARRRINLYA